jgi:hypothetical protein
MSKYNAFVETCHGMRCYEVIAASEGEAKRLAEDYGRVKFVHRVCAVCGGVL